MQASKVILLGVLLLGGCARRDYGGLCKLATEILGEPRITPDMRFDRFVKDAKNVAFGMDTRKVVDLLPLAPPEVRYELMVRAASEAGLDDWSCPALPNVLNPPAATSD